MMECWSDCKVVGLTLPRVGLTSLGASDYFFKQADLTGLGGCGGLIGLANFLLASFLGVEYLHSRTSTLERCCS
jgi:hypothetical protein